MTQLINGERIEWLPDNFDWNAPRYEHEGEVIEGPYALYEFMHKACPHTYERIPMDYYPVPADMCSICGEVFQPRAGGHEQEGN